MLIWWPGGSQKSPFLISLPCRARASLHGARLEKWGLPRLPGLLATAGLFLPLTDPMLSMG